MSKRFGRNQKRKLREEIASLKEQVQWKQATIDTNTRAWRKANYCLEVFERAVPDSIVFRGANNNRIGRHVREYAKNRTPLLSFGFKEADLDDVISRIPTVRLHQLETEIRDSPLEDAVILEVGVNRERAGLKLSMEAFDLLTEEELAEEIAIELAVHLKRYRHG